MSAVPVTSLGVATVESAAGPPITQSRIHVEKLDALTSLRFFAAAMIVIYHLNQNNASNLPMFLGTLTLTAGVSFFFILSGFILTYVYSATPKLNVQRFLVARVRLLQLATVLIMFPWTYHIWLRTWSVNQQIGIVFTQLTLKHG